MVSVAHRHEALREGAGRATASAIVDASAQRRNRPPTGATTTTKATTRFRTTPAQTVGASGPGSQGAGGDARRRGGDRRRTTRTIARQTTVRAASGVSGGAESAINRAAGHAAGSEPKGGAATVEAVGALSLRVRGTPSRCRCRRQPTRAPWCRHRRAAPTLVSAYGRLCRPRLQVKVFRLALGATRRSTTGVGRAGTVASTVVDVTGVAGNRRRTGRMTRQTTTTARPSREKLPQATALRVTTMTTPHRPKRRLQRRVGGAEAGPMKSTRRKRSPERMMASTQTTTAPTRSRASGRRCVRLPGRLYVKRATCALRPVARQLRRHVRGSGSRWSTADRDRRRRGSTCARTIQSRRSSWSRTSRG
mmetsp:Transcript_6904/g.24552  ORF Transcript_6904/g.24552 Transcript_6904/m.24552 type:complete len:364 (+) Transcript_6904:131-1222(+)